MSINLKWYSHSGSNTSDNRDFCGIRFNRNYNLYIIVDGTTDSPNSGDLAKELVKTIIESKTIAPTQIALTQSIKAIHSKLRLKYISASAAFLIVIHYPDGNLITYHSGDCLVGKLYNDNQIQWLLTPHTLANATTCRCHQDLANDPSRHYLTRSFRTRYIEPEFNSIQLSKSDQILLATDGFWAGLEIEAQMSLIQEGEVPKTALDDISYLLLNSKIENETIKQTNTKNLLIFNSNESGTEL